MPLKIIVGLIIYLVGAYLVLRIVKKYDPTTTYLEMLMPFYNYYVLAKQVFTDPATYVCVVTLLALCSSVAQGAQLSGLSALLGILCLILSARLWGLIATGMGKNFWVYAILSMLGILHVIVVLILAFDGTVVRRDKFSWLIWKPISERMVPPPPPPLD